ncbi:GIY-YIG nuclease family protein [Maribacter sp. 2304DJ31-5]|uniref:GIY-YIG nuclease family protein n=1 Tax=Maribacter sp. 2304DJ31-5 TaxID=3386273 RepID=UPI0039BD2E5E
MSKKKTLEDIFNDDEFGILDSKPKKSNVKSEDERLIELFQEINVFFEKNNREPEATNVTEFKLLSRLKALRNDASKIETLKQYDIHNLLNTKEEIKSVADIIKDDDLGILDTEEALSIFKIKHVPSITERAETDFVARRKPMKDEEFALYEDKFKQVQKELREGKRKLVNFNYESLKTNEYYINNGILLYLESIEWEKRIQEFDSGVHNRPDGRTVTIFENGTKSNMMFQSLYKVLHYNGQMVTNPDSEIEKELFNNANAVNEEDIETGWVYVLKSKSTHDKISTIINLYKIGYSTVPVPERIKNASKEPTYLMADVDIVASYKTYNLNAQKFEHLIHRFFAEVCLNIDINDEKGNRITPREWFVVPLPIINKVIGLILNGDIVNVRYDAKQEALIEISKE